MNEMYHIPTQPPEEDPDKKEGKRKSGKLKKLAVGTLATLTAAGSIFLGGKLAGNNETVEAKPVTASASATPGARETEMPAPQQNFEAAPNPELWNEENVPLLIDVDGDGTLETYEGVEKAVKALEISATDNPTIEEAVPVLMDRINTLMNWGTSKEAATFYSKYLSVSENLEGAWGVGSDYVNTVLTRALTAPPQGPDSLGLPGASAKEWATELGSLRNSVLEYNGIATSPQFSGGSTPYGIKFSLDGLKVGDPVAESDIKGATILCSYGDNYSETTIPEYMNQQGAEGLYGKKGASGEWRVNMQIQGKVWKVTDNDYSNFG